MPELWKGLEFLIWGWYPKYWKNTSACIKMHVLISLTWICAIWLNRPFSWYLPSLHILILTLLDPKIKIWILICCPYSIPTEVSGEKLLKYQANSSCVIMSVILMTTLFYISIDIKGEIWCRSLLGLKGLRTDEAKCKLLKKFANARNCSLVCLL